MSTQPGGWPPPQQHSGTSRRQLVILTPILILVLAVAGIGIGLVVRTATADEIPGLALPAAGVAAPANVTADGAVVVGDPGAKVTVRVVMDLQCPVCQAFEEFNGGVLADAVRDGTAAVEYSVISFLDRAGTTEYSSRAGNASFCVANSGVENYQAWLTEMFVRQPPEFSDGLPDSDLIDIAESNGYTDPAVADCVTGRSYDLYLKAKTREVLDSGVTGTPTVFINGAEVTDRTALMTRDGLAPLIAAAR